MTFNGFTEEDFNVFKVDGLEERMKALIVHVRPKLESLGDHFAPILTALTGDEFFAHVAKHARRSVNPPKDTWVAFSRDKRGYKKHPHFQIGLWGDHIFIWFAIINEAEEKSQYARVLKEHIAEMEQVIPNHFVWSTDHTRPDASDRFDPEFLTRLENVKKAELLCGRTFTKEEAIHHDDLLNEFEKTLKTLVPLYEWVTKSAVLG
ncbi:MAG: YktB family protein [Tuberibacillus sp.]